jgi:hypothetical protein
LSLPFFNRKDETRDPTFDNFKAQHQAFGSGTREAFFMYLANLNPDDDMMCIKVFNDMYDKLYVEQPSERVFDRATQETIWNPFDKA